MSDSEQRDSDQQESANYSRDREKRGEKQLRNDTPEGETIQKLRMVYEDELRKVCETRAIDQKQQQLWMSIRKRLPISRWIERTRDKQPGMSEQKDLRAELEQYLEIFAGEARENGLTLDMERNYYREAVNLLNNYLQGETPGETDRKTLKELMIMVDYKDAKLALQILHSII